MANVSLSQSDKDYLLSSLDMAIASAKRLANRSGQLPMALDAYKSEADRIASLRLRVAAWEVDNLKAK